MSSIAIRAVAEPNVLISAVIAPHGTSARVVDLWLEGAFELVASAKLLGELERTLMREKFRKYATVQEVRDYVHLFAQLARRAEDPDLVAQLTPDPGDDYLVALARAVQAHALMSGDRHLLDLAQAEPPVLTPAGFLKVLSQG